VSVSIPILRPAAVTPAWLTDVLRAGGVSATVRAFTAKGVGAGQIGESVRFKLEYEGDPGDAPASLVGKFPSPGEESRATGVALGNYIREVNFYRHLAPSALKATPTCYFTDVDPVTSEFVLMMEDLAPAEQGDQLEFSSLERTRLAVEQAARLHASHWNDPAIDDLAWVSATRASAASAANPDSVTMLWRGFCDRYAERVTAEAQHVGDALCAGFKGFGGLDTGVRCLTHNDYRPDNMMFGTAAGGRPLTVLDWQSVSFGCGATDVAYFLGGALPTEARRTHERELVAGYHRDLIALGVSGYSAEDAWRDYRSHTFTLFLTAFFAAMIVTRTPRGDDMFFVMLDGATRQILDLDSLEFLRA
jgi:hypothetical protein